MQLGLLHNTMQLRFHCTVGTAFQMYLVLPTPASLPQNYLKRKFAIINKFPESISKTIATAHVHLQLTCGQKYKTKSAPAKILEAE